MDLDYLMSQLYHKDLWGTTFNHNLNEEDIRAALKYLIPLLKDPKSDVRQGAAKILGDLGNATVVEPLIDLLSVETEGGVKEMAHKSLGKLRDTRAIPILFGDLHKPIDGVSAGQALASFGEQIYDEVLNLFTNGDYVTRINAAITLGCLRDGRGGPFLLEQFDFYNEDDWLGYKSTVLAMLGILICEPPWLLFRDE